MTATAPGTDQGASAAPPSPPDPTSSSVAEILPPKPDDLGRATAIITAARSAQMVSFLVVGMLLARKLDQGLYGTYQQVPFLAQAIPMAISVPVGKAITYFVPRTKSPDHLLRTMAWVLGAVGLASGLAIALFPAVLRMFDPGDASLLANRVVIGAIVAMSFAQSVTDYVLIARGRRTLVAWVLLAQGVWNVLAIGGAAWLAPEPDRLRWTLLALLASTSLPAVVTYWGLLSRTRERSAEPGPGARDVLRYSLPLVLAVGVNYLAAQMDKFLVPLLFPMDQFPDAKDHYYRAAMDVPIVSAIAFTALGLVAPQLARLHGNGDEPAMLALWRRSCRGIAVATLPFAGLFFAVAVEAFTFVWGDRYEPAVPVFRWYLVRIAIAVFIPQVLLENIGATTRSLVFSGVALVTAAAFTVVLVPIYGLHGAAAATVMASLAVNWAFGGWLARHKLGCRWRDLMDWGHLVRMVVTCALAAWVSLALVDGRVGEGIPHLGRWAGSVVHLWRGAVHGAVYVAAFAVLARVLRSVSREDMEMLRGLVTRRRPAA